MPEQDREHNSEKKSLWAKSAGPCFLKVDAPGMVEKEVEYEVEKVPDLIKEKFVNLLLMILITFSALFRFRIAYNLFISNSLGYDPSG